ncbi:TetR/AcrR family transcriptional regulator [Telmatobacter bradus]|uniref:TetR/AcrR family transcriptional regulator n=1 Tax=Telmatobacter bradus TaxID=474953 RepID=UPI003B42E082
MAAEERKNTNRKNEAAQRILAATFQCIAEKGSASVSLREIALQAGVVLSQLNYYFVNREQLFAAVLRMMKQEYLENVEARMAAMQSVPQKAAFFISYNRELLVTNQALYRAFLDFFGLALWSSSFQKEMNEFLDGVSQVIESHMETSGVADSAVESPALQNSSVATLANTILATTFGIAMQYLMNPERSDLLEGFDLLQKMVLQVEGEASLRG